MSRKAQHRIIQRNADCTEGICAVCGPVDLVYEKGFPNGRCGNKFRSHGRRVKRQGTRSTFKDGTPRPDLTIQQKMLEDQAGTCAICREPFGDEKPNLDHCHTTGRIRGFLCRSCNLGLGFFKDDTYRLVEAIKYLS